MRTTSLFAGSEPPWWPPGSGSGLIQAAPAAADDYNGLLPVFVPYASGWAPNYSVHPYGLWASRVTPEQIVAERDSCQWFNAQYDTLRTQVFGFQNYLADRTDDWSAGGVPGLAGVVKANLDQSAAFLDPRVHTLFTSPTIPTRASIRRCTTATPSTTCGTS